jgi:hypothetical protein
MSRLADCSLEVLEALEKFLRNHHLARLYLTGNSVLYQKLTDLRSRVCDLSDLSDDNKSPLIYKLLVQGASGVASSLASIDLAVLSHQPIRIRCLHLDRFDDDASYTTLPTTDFSSLVTLEKLKIGIFYAVTSPLTLPASLTTLRLRSVHCSEPVVDLDKLSLLRALTIRFTKRSHPVRLVTAHHEFLAAVRWPPNLTSLNINICHPFDDVGDILPPNLTKLVLSHNDSGIMDLCAVVDRQTRLQYLRIDEKPVFIKASLPSSLKELHLNTLVITDDQTTQQVFRHFPPSMTSLSTYHVGPSKHGDDEKAWMLVLPRLRIRCQEMAIRLLSQRSDLSDEFVEFVSRLMVTHKLGSSYHWQVHIDAYTSHNSIGLSRICRLLINGVPKELIPYVIDGRPVMEGRFHSFPYNPIANETYASMAQQLLELGYTNRLNLSNCTEQEAKTMRLSDAAVRNLTDLIVVPKSYKWLDAFLSLNKLDSVSELGVKVGEDLEALIEVVHAKRAQLSRLEKIYFSTANLFDTVLSRTATNTRRLLAEMRMRPNVTDSTFVYCTTYGASQFDAGISPRPD